MPVVIYYSCPTCKTSLNDQPVLWDNCNLMTICPKCNRRVVLEAHPKCDICSRPAVDYRQKTPFGAIYGMRFFRCDIHGKGRLFECPDCGLRFDERKVFLKDGNLVASCTSCNVDFTLLHDVKCDQTGCENTATHIGWSSSTGFSKHNIAILRCEKCRGH